MGAQTTSAFAGSVDDEAERVRGIFAKSFPQSDGELDRLLPEDFTGTVSRRAPSDEDAFDWSVTLANVEAIVETANAGRAAILAAEKRAEIAEARAEEALHWLRTLHKAVLKGMPAPAS